MRIFTAKYNTYHCHVQRHAVAQKTTWLLFCKIENFEQNIKTPIDLNNHSRFLLTFTALKSSMPTIYRWGENYR